MMDEPELVVENEERFSDEEDEDSETPTKPDQPLISNTVTEKPEEPSTGLSSTTSKLSSPGDNTYIPIRLN
jgi:hypothetical protein